MSRDLFKPTIRFHCLPFTLGSFLSLCLKVLEVYRVQLVVLCHHHRCHVEVIEPFFQALSVTHEMGFVPSRRTAQRTGNEARLPSCSPSCPRPCRSAGTTRTPSDSRPTLSAPPPSSFSASRLHWITELWSPSEALWFNPNPHCLGHRRPDVRSSNVTFTAVGLKPPLDASASHNSLSTSASFFQDQDLLEKLVLSLLRHPSSFCSVGPVMTRAAS